MLFLVNLPKAAANESSIKVAVIDWCPFICPDDPERPGMLVEYTRAIFLPSDVSVDFVVHNWSRAIKLAREGKVDALLAPAKDEAPSLKFPDTEIGVQRFCFFSRAEDPWEYQGPDSLNGRAIIHVRNALPLQLRQNDYEASLISYPYNDAYMPTSTEIMLKKRVDSVLMTLYSMQDFLNQRRLHKQIKLSGCVSEQKLYLAFTPAANQGDKVKQWMKVYNRQIGVLRQQQYFDKLLTKYRLK